MKTVIQQIANAIQARQNCIKSGNNDWLDRWDSLLESIEKKKLPSGSGIDSGCRINLDQSTRTKIVIEMSFHHMNAVGYYDGWTNHVITVTPAFDGLDLKISGKDQNDIKAYLYQIFDACLMEEVDK